MVGLAATAGAGLYAARLFAEATGRSWSVGPLVPLALLSVAASWLLLRMARSDQYWPLLLCWGYVLWPQSRLDLGLALGAVSLGAFLLANLPLSRQSVLMAATVSLGALTLYVSTLAPSVLPADSGEFQLVAQVLGIAHPPGYPLYTMLGKLFTLLPVGDPAYRLNLMSAVFGTLTLGIVTRTVQRETRSAVAGLVAAAMLGLSPTFWAQSTTANIRSLTALFTALMVALLLRWGRDRSARNLAWCAGCVGLAVGHHASIGLLLPAVVGYMLAHDPRLTVQPRRWLAPLGAALASLLVLLYLPLRSLSGAPFDPSPIRSLSDFWAHVTASGFRGDMFYFRTWPALRDRLAVWVDILRVQFGAPLAVAAMMGAVPLAMKRWRRALLLVGIWALNTIAAVTYRAPQTIEYLLPSYVALALLLGLGLGVLWQGAQQVAWRRGVAAVLLSTLLVVALWRGAASYHSFQQLHRDASTRDYAEPMLREAPTDSLLLSNWHYATAFWYLQQVEGIRPDVEVRYVYPEGATPNDQVWLRRIAEGLERGPVLVTNWFPAFGQTDYRWIPLGAGWLVREGPLLELPTEVLAADAAFDGRIHLLGYQLDAKAIEPGDTLQVRVYWQPLTTLERDYSTFVQLVGPEGVVGQGDIVHRSSTYLPGEVRVDAYSMPLLLHARPGSYQLITGFYYTTSDGWQRLMTDVNDYALLGNVTARPLDQAWPSAHPLAARFVGGWRLTGVDVDTSVPGVRRFYLHWDRPRIPGGDAASARSATVQILDGNEPVAQAALPPLAGGKAATVAVDLSASATTLAVRLLGEDGAALGYIGLWGQARGILRLPTFDAASRYVPLGGEMAFLGVDDLPSTVQAGDTVRPTARFLSLRPLTDDYSVSLGIESADGGWHLRSDGTPALGAIPTLKWLGGWRIGDLRRLTLPEDAPEGPATVALTVYEAFTVRPLPVLDERLVRQGQGTRLELGAVEITR